MCSSEVFPLGIPEEFTLIFTLALKKAALRDTIYLFQISDQQGYPQVQLTLFPHCRLYAFPPASPSSHHYSLPLPLDPLPFIHHVFCLLIPPRLSSLFCIVIHFALRFLLYRDTFSILSPFSFDASFVLSLFFIRFPSLSLAPSSLCHSSLHHPLSFTFIVIHVCSMMKHWSPSQSP